MSKQPKPAPRSAGEQAVDKWRCWIERVANDVMVAVSNQRSWTELNEMWRRNRALRVPGEARDWIARMHADSAALAVRKQLDRDRRSVSLWRLLDDLERRARLMTLDAHLDDVERDGIERVLTQNAQSWLEPGTQHLDPAIAARDREALEKHGRLAREWANREAAHADEKGARYPVTYGDLASALTAVERLTAKYTLIIRCVGYPADSGLLPHRQFDESAFFRRAWHRAEWKARTWPEGWIERRGDLEPSIDALERARYFQLYRARYAIVERLRQEWRWESPDESPIRKIAGVPRPALIRRGHLVGERPAPAARIHVERRCSLRLAAVFVPCRRTRIDRLALGLCR